MSPDIRTHEDLKTSWLLDILPTVRQGVEIPKVTNSEWASPAPWAEVVARSRSRAKYDSIRKLRAKLRRLAIVRRLRHLGDPYRRGLQRQLAEEFGVVRSVTCEGMKQIMTAGGLSWHADEKPRRTGESRQSIARP
jgi:hypothetical protein